MSHSKDFFKFPWYLKKSVLGDSISQCTVILNDKHLHKFVELNLATKTQQKPISLGSKSSLSHTLFI